MNIAISTINRRINFIDLTIESIRNEVPDMPITLVAGGSKYDYLNKYQGGFTFTKVTDLYETEKTLTGIQKAAYGYYRCLTLDKTKPILIVEDDAMLLNGWYNQLQAFLSQIKNEQFIISFIKPFPDCVAQPDIQTPSLQLFAYRASVIPVAPGEHPRVITVTWCNTSAVYYSSATLQTNMAEFIKTYCIEKHAPYDLALGYYLFSMNIPIFIIVPDMVKNFGGDPVFSAMGNPEQRLHEDYSTWNFVQDKKI